jgi:hypothetical protein
MVNGILITGGAMRYNAMGMQGLLFTGCFP